MVRIAFIPGIFRRQVGDSRRFSLRFVTAFCLILLAESSRSQEAFGFTEQGGTHVEEHRGAHGPVAGQPASDGVLITIEATFTRTFTPSKNGPGVETLQIGSAKLVFLDLDTDGASAYRFQKGAQTIGSCGVLADGGSKRVAVTNLVCDPTSQPCLELQQVYPWMRYFSISSSKSNRRGFAGPTTALVKGYSHPLGWDGWPQGEGPFQEMTIFEIAQGIPETSSIRCETIDLEK